MSQYRLIQEYLTNDLPLDTRVVEKRLGRCVQYESLNAPLRYFSQKEVENSPKFWKKVEEKDYEILELSHKDEGIPYTINELWKRHSFSFNSKEDLIYSLFTGNYNIHSIKRLSDNKVFKIDDIVTFSEEDSHLEFRVNIKSFRLEDNTIYAYNHGCLKASLKNIEHKQDKDFEILTRYGTIWAGTHCEDAPIASVQRLSDGEVFSVDDKIILPNSRIVTIKKITNPEDNYIYLYYEKSGFETACVSNDKESGDWFNEINKIEKD